MILNSAQLAIAISAVLAGAVILGWILHWLWTRLAGRSADDRARLAEMVNRLHAADQARERAEQARAEAVRRLADGEAEMSTQLAAMQTRLDGAVEGREAELIKALREAQADAEAAMGGLGSARRRIAELEAELADRARSLHQDEAVEPEAESPTDRPSPNGASTAEAAGRADTKIAVHLPRRARKRIKGRTAVAR